MKKVKKNLFRIFSVYFLLMLSFGLLPLRLFDISTGNTAAGYVNSTKSIELARSRGLIYDADMNRLVADRASYISVVRPGATVLNELKKVLSDQKFQDAAEELAHGNPIALELGNTIKSDNIITSKIYKRYNYQSLATHIIGYTDESGDMGLAGIERSFDEYLSSANGSLRARYSAQANGNFLAGGKIEIADENYNNNAGVVLTIEKNVQQALENAMDKCDLKKGAAVALNVKTGGISAIVSRPEFNRSDLAAATRDENLPLFNRALGAYPVGSVFKPLVAVSALEQGIDPALEFECNGYVMCSNKSFKCLKAHGKINMAAALAYSCNCYFMNLIEKIDCLKVIELAKSLGFGSSLELADGIDVYSGTLPSEESLLSQAARYNFSFGQGELSANLLQIAGLYSAIASSGNYKEPYLVKGICDESKYIFDLHTPKPAYRLFSSKNAKLISDFLELTAREGTGQAAAVDSVDICGKTATAQSGQYIGAQERLVTWFAGYYPYEDPKYVIVVMCEEGKSGSADCAPIFADAINIINNK